MASSINFLLAILALAIIAFSSAQDIYEIYKTPDGSQEEKRNFDREFMHFGKRSNNNNNGAAAGFQLFRPLGVVYDKRASEFDRNFMPFGKRFSAADYEPLMEKKHFNREFMHFGKRSAAAFQVYPDGWPLVLIRL